MIIVRRTLRYRESNAVRWHKRKDDNDVKSLEILEKNYGRVKSCQGWIGQYQEVCLQKWCVDKKKGLGWGVGTLNRKTAASVNFTYIISKHFSFQMLCTVANFARESIDARSLLGDC